MIQLVSNSGPGSGNAAFAPRAERLDLFTVAKRMFNEGFTRSTILRITGLNEEEFMGVIREIHGRPRLA